MRKPAVAGSFYPSEGLNEMISQFFGKAETKEVKNGMIVPHAGYIYSGKTASVGYKSMLEFLKKNKEIDNIIILKPGRFFLFRMKMNMRAGMYQISIADPKLRAIPTKNAIIGSAQIFLSRNLNNAQIKEMPIKSIGVGFESHLEAPIT